MTNIQRVSILKPFSMTLWCDALVLSRHGSTGMVSGFNSEAHRLFNFWVDCGYLDYIATDQDGETGLLFDDGHVLVIGRALPDKPLAVHDTDQSSELWEMLKKQSAEYVLSADAQTACG
jgi:hypothetical protein